MKINCSYHGPIVATAILLANGAIAAPVITSASGAAVGAEVVLRGTGFGAKAKPGPALWDTVANQPSYGTIVPGASVPAGSAYPWRVNTTNKPGAVVFTNSTLRYPGAKFHYRTSQYDGDLDWPNALGGMSAPAAQRRIYASFWIRPDAPIDETSHSSKFFRIWDKSDATGTGGAWTQMHLTYNGWTGNEVVSWPSWGGKAKEWNRLEFYVDADSHAIQAVTNGVVRHKGSDYRKNPEFDSIGLSIARLGWDRGGTSPPSVDLTFGDIYVDSTPARVEICLQPSWELCRNREVQIATAWSNSEIKFTLEPRSLASAGTVYAFVVDSNNVASPVGFELRIGDDRPEPKAPGSLIIE